MAPVALAVVGAGAGASVYYDRQLSVEKTTLSLHAKFQEKHFQPTTIASKLTVSSHRLLPALIAPRFFRGGRWPESPVRACRFQSP